nr:hypothetical protein [Tanacetum cinerariifolium]
KFDEKNDFGLWRVRMKALLEQHGLAEVLEELHVATIVAYDNIIQKKGLQCKSQSEHIDEFHKMDTLKIEDVLTTLNSRELQKMTKANGDGGEGFECRVRGMGKVQVWMRDGSSFVLNNVRRKPPTAPVGRVEALVVEELRRMCRTKLRYQYDVSWGMDAAYRLPVQF